MSFAEILDELPKLSFVERQQLIRQAVELDEGSLTAEEESILDERLSDFHRDPTSGTPLAELKQQVLDRLRRQ